MPPISFQLAREYLSEPRLRPYLQQSHNDPDKAIELYQWAVELEGAFHATFFLEVSLRSALDSHLIRWNGGAWTFPGAAKHELFRT